MSFDCLSGHHPTLGLGKFFDDAQRHKNGHPAIISSMYKLSRKANIQLFTIEFLQCLSCALIQKEKSPHALTVLDFAAKFCCHHTKNISEDDDDIFFACVIKYVTKVSDGKHTVVRQRVCEFVSLLLASMSVDATIDVEIFEIITQCMLDRAKDKLATVRVHAFAALQRLQDPQDNDCLVTKAFIYHLECDPSAEVRKHILKNIAITQHSLPAVISRSRDFNEVVRKEMYQTIAKIKAKRLRIRQRQEILTNGLGDSSEVVKDHVIKKLIPTWFDDCEKDYLKLLELFYVESFSLDTITNLLTSLFKRRASADLLDLVKSWQNPDNVIPIDELTSEKALMWLTIVKYFRNPPSDVKLNEEAVFEIFPELTYFSQYLKEYRKKLVKNDITSEYIFMRLLDLVLQFTLTDDEKGREEVKNLAQDMLLCNDTESEELIKLLSRILSFLIPDVRERLEIVAMIISDIQHPLEEQDNFNEDSDIIEESLSEIPIDMENLRINSTGASNNMDQLDFRNVKMLPKCLLMLIEILKANDVNTLNPVLDTLQKNFIINCFKVDNSYVSSLSISALSLLCLKSQDLAKENFIKFLYTFESEALQLSSLEAIFDQIIFYGMDICHLSVDKSSEKDQIKKKRDPSLDFYDDPTIPRTSIKHLLNRLSSCLFSQVLHIRSITCQGFAKLLLTTRIKSSFALAKLVMLWFSPVLGSDSCVSQPLGIFFDLYAKKIPDAGEVILNSLIPALEHLTSKDCDANLASVDPTRVANLLLDALKKVPSPEEGPSYHCQAANLVCDEILNRGVKSEASLCIALTKCFYHLELSKSDKEFAEDLIDKFPFVLTKVEKLKEKSVKRIATNFFSKLNSMWAMKKSKTSSEVSTNKLTKPSESFKSDKSQMNNENGEFEFSATRISEPIIEEYSGSEDENANGDQIADDGASDIGNEVIPGTPESEDSNSEDSKKYPSPPVTRKQRRLIL